jgi:hypothetical protein
MSKIISSKVVEGSESSVQDLKFVKQSAEGSGWKF